jgi:hypothetical protein
MIIFLLQKNGITSLQKHVDANHIVVVKRFEEVNNSLKQTKKKQIYLENQISKKLL